MKYLTLILTALIISFATPVYAGHGDHASQAKVYKGEVAHVSVNGLVCDFCARALEKVFGKQEAVSDIDVDLNGKLITINFNEDQTLDDETITKFVQDSGYSVEGIHRVE
jgi:copper chaperone CopZ